jgi:hypothetical protein
MTLKVLANKTLYFDRGERDKHGQLVRVKTTVGKFCELPDWVAKTDYYKLAIKDGSLQAFNSNSESDANAKLFEENQSLLEEIRLLKEQRETMSGAPEYKSEKAELNKSADKISVSLNPPIYLKEGDVMPDPSVAATIPVIFNDTRAGSEKLEAVLDVTPAPKASQKAK